ncbi:MAG: hypothetical protein AB7F75_00920 [Planctomycetota bacterium]
MKRKRPRAGRPGILATSEELTGFPPETSPHVSRPDDAPERPLSMAWISDELLAKTRRVWSRAYERPVGVEEAVEILTNVKHLAEALVRARQGGDET